MTGLVVITRPRDEAAALAETLAARGYRTLIEPMLTIVPTEAPVPPLAEYRALVFTSANGARIFAARSSERSLPAFAVGAQTAAILRDAGFGRITTAAGDAAALAESIARDLSPGEPLLHISGEDVARDLGALLAPADIVIDRMVAYRAAAAEAFSSDLVRALYACTIGHVLFFSARTAGIFGTLLNQRGLTAMISSSSALCLSSQIAAAAEALPWRAVQVSAAPTADSLIALLPSRGPVDDR